VINVLLILPVAVDGPRFEYGQGKRFSFLQNGPDRVMGHHPASNSMTTGVLS